MAIMRHFNNDELFSIKVIDDSVRTGYKVATIRSFEETGTSNRPGFSVAFSSTEGVGRTSQIIRFTSREIAQRWINRNAARYGYSLDDMAVMVTRPGEIGSGEFVKIPLCDYQYDAWVSSDFITRIMSNSPRTWERIKQACPEYFREENNIEANQRRRYRGFRF